MAKSNFMDQVVATDRGYSTAPMPAESTENMKEALVGLVALAQ